MNIIRVCLNKEKKGFVTCRQCGITHIIDVSKRSDMIEKPVLAKCNCGMVSKIIFERKFHRIKTSIPATLYHANALQLAEQVLITSLSVGDVGFLTSGNNIKMDQTYRLKFALDDPMRQEISKGIVIRRVNGNDVGAEFQDRESYDHALDFYTMPLVPIKDAF
jgi:hypothetical protein